VNAQLYEKLRASRQKLTDMSAAAAKHRLKKPDTFTKAEQLLEFHKGWHKPLKKIEEKEGCYKIAIR
jgi:hypothetical protein